MFNFLKKNEWSHDDSLDVDLLGQKERGQFIAWRFTKTNFANGSPRWIRYENLGGIKHDKIHLYSQYGGTKISGEYNGTSINEYDYIVSDENDNIIIMSTEEFNALPGKFIYSNENIIRIM